MKKLMKPFYKAAADDGFGGDYPTLCPHTWHTDYEDAVDCAEENFGEYGLYWWIVMVKEVVPVTLTKDLQS